MGNHHFHHHHHNHHNHNNDNNNDIKNKVAEDEALNEQDRKLIRSSWNQLKLSQDFKSLGADLMARIFIQHPEVKFIWKFAANLKTEEEYRNSSALKSHGYKVVESLNSYVNALDKTESLDKLLFDLGSRHSQYGDGKILICYFDIVTRAILETIKEGLSNDFTPEMSQAWKNGILHLKKHTVSGFSENHKK